MPAQSPVLPVFLLFVLINGGGSVAVRLCYAEMSPFWVGASRYLLAGLAFWLLAAARRIPFPRGRALAGAVVFGVLTVGLTFILISWGLVATPASRYQILMSIVPLLTIFLASLHGIEAVSWRGVAGSLLAVAGIAFTMGGGGAAQLSAPHVAAILVAAVFLAEGGVLIKMFPPVPPILMSAIGLTIGAVMLGTASLLAGERWTLPVLPGTWIAYLYLLLFVTVGSFLLYLIVLGRWSASKTSYGFVLVPLVTIVVASSLAGERITPGFLAGAGLVLAGVLVGALLPTARKPAAVEECRDRAGQVLPRCI